MQINLHFKRSNRQKDLVNSTHKGAALGKLRTPRGRRACRVHTWGKGSNYGRRHVNTPEAHPKKHSGLNVTSSVMRLRPVVKRGSKNTEREIGVIPRMISGNPHLATMRAQIDSAPQNIGLEVEALLATAHKAGETKAH